MGVSGPGNFGNEAAVDFAAREVVAPLTARLGRVVEDPALAHPGEDASAEALAAAEILAVLCEQLRLRPPPTHVVEGCREACLRGWDEGIDRLDPKPGYKERRRAVIAATFDRLLAVCRERDRRQG
jgi:hypothetical protein